MLTNPPKQGRPPTENPRKERCVIYLTHDERAWLAKRGLPYSQFFIQALQEAMRADKSTV